LIKISSHRSPVITEKQEEAAKRDAADEVSRQAVVAVVAVVACANQPRYDPLCKIMIGFP
jgi:hypothetical protein